MVPVEVAGDGVEGLRWTVERMAACLDRPVLDEAELLDEVRRREGG